MATLDVLDTLVTVDVLDLLDTLDELDLALELVVDETRLLLLLLPESRDASWYISSLLPAPQYSY